MSCMLQVSPFLGTIITQVDPYQTKVVHVSLPDIKYADLVNLVQFIYAGEITLNQRQCGILQKWLRALHIQLALQKSSLNIQDDGKNEVLRPYFSTNPTYKTLILNKNWCIYVVGFQKVGFV